MFTDRTVSPSYVVDVAEATRRVLAGDAPPGLYHCVNAGACTWQALALEAGRLMGRTPRLRPIEFKTVVLPASRPMYCALSSDRLASLGIVMPPWQDALARHIATRGAQKP